MSKKTTKTPEIVLSSHLVSPKSKELSELEFGLLIANNAFQRWVIRCTHAAGGSGLSATESLVMHHINHKNLSKKLADICFAMNIEDSHIVLYSIKKLVKQNLVISEKKGKEVFYSTTDDGKKLCNNYKEVRESCLISALEKEGIKNTDIEHMATLLRVVSGLYDQAARAATVSNFYDE